MVKLLANSACVGIVTNQLFLQSCLLHDKFSDPGYTTSFIPQNLHALLKSPYDDIASEVNGGLPLLLSHILRSTLQRRKHRPGAFPNVRTNFRNQALDPVNDALRQIVVTGSDLTRRPAYICTWSMPQPAKGHATATIAPVPGGDKPRSATERYNILSNALRDGKLSEERKYNITVKETCTEVSAARSSTPWIQTTMNCLLNGKNVALHLTADERRIDYSLSSQTAEGTRVLCHVPLLGTWFEITCFSTLSYFEFIREKGEVSADKGKRDILAPMPCKVLLVLKKDGDLVKAGDKVVIVESMKMEINIFASIDGIFNGKVRENDAVDEGKVLCSVEKSN